MVNEIPRPPPLRGRRLIALGASPVRGLRPPTPPTPLPRSFVRLAGQGASPPDTPSPRSLGNAVQRASVRAFVFRRASSTWERSTGRQRGALGRANQRLA